MRRSVLFSMGYVPSALLALVVLNPGLRGETPAPEQAAANEQQVVSIGDALRHRGVEPLHILYMHGIGANGAGDSELLRESICSHAKQYLGTRCTTKEGDRTGREYVDQGEFADGHAPADVDYMGAPMWATAEEWQAAAPFVDHYLIRLENGQSILVDELNWWPLVFAAKCQHMIPNETFLAGSLDGKNDNFLKLCSQPARHDRFDNKRFDTYDWVHAPGGLDPNSSPANHAVAANRWAKVQIMDWNFSDALLGVGPLEGHLVEAIRQLLVKCVKTGEAETRSLTGRPPSPSPSGGDFITITHSLGSFLMFSALHTGYEPKGISLSEAEIQERQAALNQILGRLSQAYFFANQIPLLELAKLSSSRNSTFLDLSSWRDARRDAVQDSTQPLGQIVAWGDVNDLLTWYLGKDFREWQNPVDPKAHAEQRFFIKDYPVKNSPTWYFLGLLEWPESAHDDYAKNPAVIRALLKPRQP
jgi:hypothetical protein